MINGYERASKEVVPAIRLLIARRLKEKYNLTEVRISEILGVAQAAVSKYLNGKYSDIVAKTAEKIDLSELDSHLDAIANGNSTELNKCICTVCNSVNKFKCSFSAINAK